MIRLSAVFGWSIFTLTACAHGPQFPWPQKQEVDRPPCLRAGKNADNGLRSNPIPGPSEEGF